MPYTNYLEKERDFNLLAELKSFFGSKKAEGSEIGVGSNVVQFSNLESFQIGRQIKVWLQEDFRLYFSLFRFKQDGRYYGIVLEKNSEGKEELVIKSSASISFDLEGDAQKEDLQNLTEKIGQEFLTRFDFITATTKEDFLQKLNEQYRAIAKSVLKNTELFFDEEEFKTLLSFANLPIEFSSNGKKYQVGYGKESGSYRFFIKDLSTSFVINKGEDVEYKKDFLAGNVDRFLQDAKVHLRSNLGKLTPLYEANSAFLQHNKARQSYEATNVETTISLAENIGGRSRQQDSIAVGRVKNSSAKLNPEQFLVQAFKAATLGCKEYCAGSTLCAAIAQKSGEDIKITTANLGDSRVMAVLQYKDGGESEVIQLTTDHKPDSPKVKAYIESQGGKVATINGVSRVNGVFAVGAAVGDMHFPLLRRPEVKSFMLNGLAEGKELLRATLLVCCDGITDALNSAKIASSVQKAKEGDNIAKILVDEASLISAGDNVSASCVDLLKMAKQADDRPFLAVVADGHVDNISFNPEGAKKYADGLLVSSEAAAIICAEAELEQIVGLEINPQYQPFFDYFFNLQLVKKADLPAAENIAAAKEQKRPTTRDLSAKEAASLSDHEQGVQKSWI